MRWCRDGIGMGMGMEVLGWGGGGWIGCSYVPLM